MNAAARALAHGTFNFENIREMALSPRNYLVSLLLLLVLASACGVVYLKDLNRRLFWDLQTLQQQYDDLNIRAGQLLLERNTWSAQARVEQIAQNQLAMDVPTAQIVVTQ